MSMGRLHGLAAGCLAASLVSAAADTPAPAISPVRPFWVEGVFQTAERPPARDLSGIACKPAPDGTAPRLCLVVNDSDRFAQVAILADGRIAPGPTVALLGGQPSPATVGAPPQAVACSAGEARFSDLDGEGVAYAEPYFYVVGSHGCSRKREEAVPSAFVLVRIRVDRDGLPVGKGKEAVEATYRLGDVLRNTPELRDHFGRD